jgi:hypothetical protein
MTVLSLSVLIVLVLAVFGFLAWWIMARQAAVRPKADDAYECPICNEFHCDCRKKE